MGRKDHNYSTLPELLMSKIEEGVLERKNIAEAGMRSHDWACDLVNASEDPDWWRQLRLLIQRLPVTVAHEMVALLLAGSPFETPALRGGALELDVNGDGKVNLSDAVDSAINGQDAKQEALKLVRDAEKAGTLPALLATGIVAEISRAHRADEVVLQILRLFTPKPAVAGRITA